MTGTSEPVETSRRAARRSATSRRRLRVPALLFISALSAAACSGDHPADTSAPAPISSLTDWCTEINAVNDLIATSNQPDTDFAATVADYRLIGDRLRDLTSSLAAVPAGRRPDVAAALDIFDRLTTAILTSANEAEANQRVAGILASPTTMAAQDGATWIRQRCAAS